MPADHLSTTRRTSEPADLAAAVLEVLAGIDASTVASRRLLDLGDLDDAVRTYQSGGLAALERAAESPWYQVRVQFADWSAAEKVGATTLGPALDQLRAAGALAGWWFLRKHPCWRLRLLHADATAVDRVLNELTDSGAVTRWWTTVYEPETAAFGGAAGMDTVHDLFCADSSGVLDYLRQTNPGLGRRELSVLLLSGLMRAAGLDTFECGDVFERVARMRPTPIGDDAARFDKLVENVRVLLSIQDLPASELFARGGPVAHTSPWLAALCSTGEQLGHAAANGHLDRGLRAVVSQIVIFHWNRIGLTASSQGALARAAATALLPRS